MAGHLKKAGAEGVKFLREFRMRPGDGDLKQGDRVLVDEFKPTGQSGRDRRQQGPRFHRAGQAASFQGGPGVARFDVPPRAGIDRRIELSVARVSRNAHGRAHRATQQVTVRNLEIVDVDAEDNVLVVKGAVPGPNGGYVMVRRAKR